jgi:hypothetical protein
MIPKIPAIISLDSINWLVFVTESQAYFLLCKIWGSHSGGYKEFYLLEYNAV